MYHNQQVANTPDLLNPLEIEVATLAQSDAHCHSFSRPYADENAYRYQEDDENAGRFQVPLPGGASIFMKDPVGTSLSLNLDIDASSGTPILSGRAINAQGNVLDVHSCSCDNPSSVRHKLPLCGGLESSPNRTHVSPFPKSPFNHHRRPAPIFTRNHTPLIVVQTRLPHSPSESEFEQRPSVSVPEVSADTLGSPFTPTLASMQCIFQTSNPSPNPNPNHSFHTPPACFEVTSAPHMSPDLPELPLETPTSLYEVPPRLNTQSEQSPFDIDFDNPLVQSPTSVGPFSDISGPSALGSVPSSPSTPSDSASWCSNRTVLPHSYQVTDVRPDTNLPHSPEVAVPQGSNQLTVTNDTLPSPPDASLHLADTGTTGTPRHDALTATEEALHIVNTVANLLGSNPTSISDLYTDRVIADPSFPIARIGPDGPPLQYDSTYLKPQPNAIPTTEQPVNPSRVESGYIKGTWVADLRQDHMALTLDFKLDGLGLQNLSLSIPNPGQPTTPYCLIADLPVPVAETCQDKFVFEEEDCPWDVKSNSSQSVMSFGSCPSTAPPLSDLPLTPIPELLHTPTKQSMQIIGLATPERERERPLSRSRSPTPNTHNNEKQQQQQHPPSRIPGPLDSGPILSQLAQGGNDIRSIQSALHDLAHEWKNIMTMPDGGALRTVEVDCTALYRALADLTLIITLIWPPMRQPSLGTEGGQPTALEWQLQLQNMCDTESKWYMKQHEFTASLQRNLTRLALLAQRVREDADDAYRGNVLQRISQFKVKFEDIALRLKLTHHIRIEQKYRMRVRNASRRTVTSPEQAAAHDHNRARLAKVREDIEEIKSALLAVGSPRQIPLWR